MVDFHNPAVIEKDFLVVVKIWHVVDGIFIWEFVANLDYELSVIRGHRPYRWTIWVYSLTRVCTLIAVVLNMLGFDSSSSINCQLWIIFELIFAYSAFAAASLLIVLRIVAIWDRNRIAVAIAICAWNSNFAFFVYNTALIHATWEPTQSVCLVLNTKVTTKTILAVFVSDVVLLLTMLVGLLRLRVHGTMFALGQFLWRQGLIWLFFATVAELTPAVFISLNLNYPFNLMFQTPGLVVMSIAATRIHRSLIDYTHPNSHAFDIHATGRGIMAISSPKPIFPAQIPPQVPPNGLEVVLMSSEDYPSTNVGLDGADSQSQDTSLVSDIRNGLEKGIKSG
ncbi:hypothetical protein V8E53_000272 [Lactarius tabidus]